MLFRQKFVTPPGSVLYSYITSGGKLKERQGGSITEGIGQGRVTDNLKDEVDELDGAVLISDEKSIEMVYRCLDEEGLYLGASSALNVVAAKEVAERLGPGNTVVTVLCDGAYRYADRLFSDKWLRSKGLRDAITGEAGEVYRATIDGDRCVSKVEHEAHLGIF